MLGSGIQPLPVAVITTQDIGSTKWNQSTSALSGLTFNVQRSGFYPSCVEHGG